MPGIEAAIASRAEREIVPGHPGLGQRLLDGVGRLGVQRVVRAGHVAVRADVSEDVEPGPFGIICGRHHDGGRTVRDL